MKDLEYTKPVLEEADFGKFVAGESVKNDGDTAFEGVEGGRG